MLRDHHGGFQAAQGKWYERGLNVCLMEALAYRDGPKIAAEMGLPRVMLEIDSLEVCQLWKNRDTQRFIFRPSIEGDRRT